MSKSEKSSGKQHKPGNGPFAQEQYLPILTRTLGQLARTGFAVPWNDGQDLIHDFFLTEWAGLETRFDPTGGKRFEDYLAKAFIYFARRRIYDLNRWRRQLADTSLLAQTTESRPNVEDPERSEDAVEKQRRIAAVSQALSGIPEEEKALLLDYLGDRKRSERSLADERGWSRYQVREALVEAFGRVVVAVGEQGRFSDIEWRVAHELWGRGRTLPEAAQALAMSATDVRTIRDDILSRMAESLQSDRRSGGK